MTELYARVPLWLSLDPGVRSLPAPARVALYEIAAAGGAVRCGDAPAETLEACCAGAGEHLTRILTRGVIALDAGRILLVAPDGTPSTIGAATAEHHAHATIAQGVADEDRSAEKRLRGLWSCAKLRTREEREAWVRSEAGVRFLAREQTRAPGADRSEAWAIGVAAVEGNRGRFGAVASTAASLATDGDKHGDKSTRLVDKCGDKPGDKSSPLSDSLPSENKKEDDDKAGRASGDKHGDKPGDKSTTVAGDKSDKPDVTEMAVAVVAALIEGSGGTIPKPDVATARHLGAALLDCGMSHDEARAWGRDLATPVGRKTTWPWLQRIDRSIDVAFLRSCDMSRGEQPYTRVRDGVATWRASRSRKARAQAPAAPKAPSVEEPSKESTVATMRQLAEERAARRKEAAHG